MKKLMIVISAIGLSLLTFNGFAQTTMTLPNGYHSILAQDDSAATSDDSSTSDQDTSIDDTSSNDSANTDSTDSDSSSSDSSDSNSDDTSDYPED